MRSSSLPTEFVAVEDTSFELFDNHTHQTIRCNHLLSAKDICRTFKITKGQLNKAVKRGEFPKATTMLAGALPRWADTVIARVRRVA